MDENGFPDGSGKIKNLPAMQEVQETRVRSLGWEDPLEKEMDTHSSIVAWRIPWIKILLIPYKTVSGNPAGN